MAAILVVCLVFRTRRGIAYHFRSPWPFQSCSFLWIKLVPCWSAEKTFGRGKWPECSLAMSTFFLGRARLAPRANVFFVALCGQSKKFVSRYLTLFDTKICFCWSFQSNYFCLCAVPIHWPWLLLFLSLRDPYQYLQWWCYSQTGKLCLRQQDNIPRQPG